MGAVTIESTPQTENRHQQKHDSWWNPMKKETTTRKRTSETNISISLPNPMNLLILTYFDLVISHCFHHISTFRFPPGRAVPWRSPAVNPSAAPGLRDPSATTPLRGHLTEKRSFVCVCVLFLFVHVYIHTYIYIYIYNIHIYIYIRFFMYIHLCIYLFMHLFIYLFVRVRFWIKCGSKKERYQCPPFVFRQDAGLSLQDRQQHVAHLGGLAAHRGLEETIQGLLSSIPADPGASGFLLTQEPWKKISGWQFRNLIHGSQWSCLVLVRKHHPWLGTPMLRQLRKVAAS